MCATSTMATRNNLLQLEISQGGRGNESFEHTMGGTYRDEGLSVGSDHMVICYYACCTILITS